MGGFCGLVSRLYEPGFYLDLVSVIMSSWGNDMSVYMAVANMVQHGSYGDAKWPC